VTQTVRDTSGARTLPEEIRGIAVTSRITALKEAMLSETRYLSVEQARLITESYREHPDLPRVLQRAYALEKALTQMAIRIDPGELIVGNRTTGVRAGVVSPEAGLSWISEEIDTLGSRPQDPFQVRPEDKNVLRDEILPFWRGKTLEDTVSARIGVQLEAVRRVVKINQTDHAQGHISPNLRRWLGEGPAGIQHAAERRMRYVKPDEKPFLQALTIVLKAARHLMIRYAREAQQIAAEQPASVKTELLEVGRICSALAERPPETFHEALQATWFLFVVLHMESNASSFSPGRLDQIVMPYLKRDLDTGRATLARAQELVDALWLKFNQIVYMRSAASAEYFAGFPIGFNVAIGGMDKNGRDATNPASYLFLNAQRHLGLPQPNLTARLWDGSPRQFIEECARVIGLGSGMPQIVSDRSIIPALERVGITAEDARDYAVVGCVELSTAGNNLGWSDAAMFNLVKVLELTLNNGVCMLSGEQMGPQTGTLESFGTFESLEEAYRVQLDYFIDRMMPLCDAVDHLHAELLPSPFLSSVIDSCLENARDVTAGGAHYNLSGIQAIQVANVADSFAALKKLVYEDESVNPARLLHALRTNFEGAQTFRQMLVHKAPKYGNDVAWVDELGNKWARYFARRLAEFTNARGGPYHMGLYTVSAHVPMGKNVAATPDGRLSESPLADGGMSAAYGRDTHGPTALLRSVSRIQSLYASNGTLLNMKFLPRTFTNAEEFGKFVAMLESFCHLGIHHVQFNVVDRETLLAARRFPEQYRNLTIRVAGYTAYFVELASDLQEEIIARTSFGV